MIPVVALVGRPNVGKSTLFNRFTRTQNALVADFPGLTRDRQYGQAVYNQHHFIVIDTGGIGVDDLAVDSLMSKQSALALAEACAILFVVDGRDGLTGIDEEVCKRLRKLNKPVILVANKAEGLHDETVLAEFQQLGLAQLHAVSAAHGQGMDALLHTLIKSFPDTEAVETPVYPQAINIAFVGRPNVGKSTLINRILGEERVVVYDMPGTTRDSITIPFHHQTQDYVLVDTAGVRRRARIDQKIEKFSVIKTLQAIKAAHVCIMLVDAKEGLTEQDMHLLGFIVEAGKALVIAVNKWDNLTQDHKESVKNELERRLHFVNFAKMRFISALHGSGVGLLFQDINQAYQAATAKLSTPKLTRLLEEAVAKHAPPLVNGRRIKLRYAHTGGHNPPTIVIHGNQLSALPDSYKRYLTNWFIEALELIGTPLKIELKSSTNPFKDKKNALTTRQVKRKKRLMKHVKKRGYK
ncbi:MAG: ribosome biogenesis GTPase Der [Legionellaceae bacterium]|nr:ribosome biogenesis GTPase Der [Legionellaceae bacterium]HCA88851.1 ribosome biogenesis GTPase Der [Legionellales bacterium]|tara:strand:+ start:608 stop:2008 length:1401 start_codon:yes stop_codon:yes gene_type:complete